MQIFKNFVRGLKNHGRNEIFFTELSKKILHFFMQKRELIYLENCQFHSDLLLELFKTANFFKKS